MKNPTLETIKKARLVAEKFEQGKNSTEIGKELNHHPNYILYLKRVAKDLRSEQL